MRGQFYDTIGMVNEEEKEDKECASPKADEMMTRDRRRFAVGMMNDGCDTCRCHLDRTYSFS